MCEFTLITGAVAASIIVGGFWNAFCFPICWICYVSMYMMGLQVFFSFQWDILLLEAGFLAILSSMWSWLPLLQPCQWESIMAHGFRFLIFKLMLMAGLVKLQAHCPTWENLTALEYHFATQCIPTPLAWFAHQLPPILLRIAVAATLVIEIPLSILLVAPGAAVRR